MKFSAVLTLLGLAATAMADADNKIPGFPGLQVTPAFTANLTLGTTLTIPIEGGAGGLRIIRPITGGTLSGPLFEGTVLGGFASPIYYNGGAQEAPEVYLFGTAKDGSAFYIQEKGVGDPASWLTRANVETQGQYASLSNQYFVANNAADKTKPVITVPVYKVTGSGCC